MTLHVLQWGLDMPRATQDADLGVRPVVVRTPELTDRLMALGYTKTSGNRFEKPVPEVAAETADPPKAVIDILVPFSRGGLGVEQIRRTLNRSDEPATALETRMQAAALKSVGALLTR